MQLAFGIAAEAEGLEQGLFLAQHLVGDQVADADPTQVARLRGATENNCKRCLQSEKQ